MTSFPDKMTSKGLQQGGGWFAPTSHQKLNGTEHQRTPDQESCDRVIRYPRFLLGSVKRFRSDRGSDFLKKTAAQQMSLFCLLLTLGLKRPLGFHKPNCTSCGMGKLQCFAVWLEMVELVGNDLEMH